ncbi:MAG: Uma2 family endonuclease [Acidimicrobiales bacterium]
MVLISHPTQPFDLNDLLELPDDGYRYEVLDGALVVNAAPSWRHQEVVARLTRLLEDAKPTSLKALPSPTWRISPGQVPEPDVVVVEPAALGEHAVEGTPLLAVEVLSPSNRGTDLVRKRALYAEASCPSYWIVDPEEPSLLVLRLAGKSYVEVAKVTGNERFEVNEPFLMTVCPADLVAG